MFTIEEFSWRACDEELVLVVPSRIAIAMREVGLRCDSDSNSDGGGRVALRVKGLVLLGECCKGIDGR